VIDIPDKRVENFNKLIDVAEESVGTSKLDLTLYNIREVITDVYAILNYEK